MHNYNIIQVVINKPSQGNGGSDARYRLTTPSTTLSPYPHRLTLTPLISTVAWLSPSTFKARFTGGGRVASRTMTCLRQLWSAGDTSRNGGTGDSLWCGLKKEMKQSSWAPCVSCPAAYSKHRKRFKRYLRRHTSIVFSHFFQLHAACNNVQ